MNEIIVRLLLSLSSYSGVIYFFVINRQDIPYISMRLFGVVNQDTFWARNFIYTVLFVLLAYLTLLVTKKVFRAGDSLIVSEVRPIESVAVPTYIGLFVIALGISNSGDASAVLVLVALFLLWTRLEKIFYFNPIWLFFGYRFYEVKSKDGNVYTLVTKKDKLKGSSKFANLRRINDYTFLED